MTKLKSSGVMALSVLASALDLFVFSVMPTYWQALPSRVANGGSYAMMLVACVSYADELAPPGFGATSQGVLVAVQSGLCRALGGVMAGFLYDQVGLSHTFLMGSTGLMLSLMLILVTRWWLGRMQHAGHVDGVP